MNKKRLLLILILLLASFGITFALSVWLGGPAGAEGDAAEKQAAVGAVEAEAGLLGVDGKPVSLRPDEKLTTGLIKELRSKLEQLRLQQRKLEEEQHRIEMAKVVLRNEAKKLESLRVRLVAPLDRLKQARKDLNDSRIQIKEAELANLRLAAGIYDKMSAEESSPIFQNMIENQQLDDAVKILRFMSERTAAKVLGQLPKDVAGQLMEGLKRIQQEAYQKKG